MRTPASKPTSQAQRLIVLRRAGVTCSTSTSTSRSESGCASPRAREPNTMVLYSGTWRSMSACLRCSANCMSKSVSIASLSQYDTLSQLSCTTGSMVCHFDLNQPQLEVGQIRVIEGELALEG